MVYQQKLEHATTPELLPLSDVKLHLKIEADFIYDDALIQAYTAAAIQVAEKYTETTIQQTKVLLYAKTLAEFQCLKSLPVHPVTEVESVKYLDTSGDLQTVDVDEYELLSLNNYQTELCFSENYSFPSVQAYKTKAIQVAVLAGYATLPSMLRAAILLIIGWLYENRTDKIDKLPKASENLMQSFRKYE